MTGPEELAERQARDTAALARAILLMPCGHIVADGHTDYDPNCAACIEANSDAPEWTI